MKIQTRFTAEAEAAALRYRTLVEGWRGLYAQALDRPQFGSSSEIERVASEAYAMSRTYLAGEQDFIERAFETIVSEALTATGNELGYIDTFDAPEALSAHEIDAQSYLTHEITIQIERDIAFLKQALRRTMLQVALAARAKDIPLRAALTQHRIGDVAELSFFFHDRRNQKWAAEKFIRAIWRQSLLSLYNETVLLVLADHGQQTAEVNHLDVKAESHGLQVAMSAASALPTYAEIRNEVFHPNSDAILRRAG